MKWKELKSEIRDLGFESDQQMTDYSTIVINSVNRAISIINADVYGAKAKTRITQDGTAEGIVTYDLADITGDFLKLEIVYRIKEGVLSVFNDYELTEESKVLMDNSLVGTFDFHYIKKLPMVTSSTSPEAEIGVATKVEHLVALLAAHYVWKDDDVQKSTDYWNEYDMLKDDFLEAQERERKPKATVIGGLTWDN